jgi:putative sterol carrier protein
MRRDNTNLEGVTGTLRFDIGDARPWYVSVNQGRVDVSEQGADADCTIGCSEEDFLKVINGEQNLITATMQGRVAIAGNLTLAHKFHAAVRARPHEGTENPR